MSWMFSVRQYLRITHTSSTGANAKRLVPTKRNFDSTLVADGFALLIYYLEAGEREFISVSTLVSEELDISLVRLRPLLRSWFNGARDFLEDNGIDLVGASTAHEVESAMARFESWGTGKSQNLPSLPKPATEEQLRELMGKALSQPTPDAIMEFARFASRMKRLGPYNMLMVYTQRPGATAIASRRDWISVGQTVRPDAIPILVLTPRGPVRSVYELMDTMPQRERDPRVDPFAASGEFDTQRFQKLVEGLTRSSSRKLRVDVEDVDYGARLAGQISCFALEGGEAQGDLFSSPPPAIDKVDQSHWSVRLNRRFSPAERFCTLLHELGHLFCGHVGSFGVDNPNADEYGWPDRTQLALAAKEIEAELVAWHICDREGLVTGSPVYLRPYLEREPDAVAQVDLDRVVRAIARVRAYLGDPTPAKKRSLI